jgi:hypothetical protein
MTGIYWGKVITLGGVIALLSTMITYIIPNEVGFAMSVSIATIIGGFCLAVSE